MKPTTILTLTIACLIAVTGTAYAGDALEVTSPGELRVIAAEGWNPVTAGVWERVHPDGRVETYATGEDGLSWVLLELRAQLETLVDRYLRSPDEDMIEVLETHMALIEDIEGNLLEAGTAGPQTKAAEPESCSQFSLGILAWAGPIICGNRAAADSHYYTTDPECPACSVYAYAYAERTCGSTTSWSSQSCGDTGRNVTCNVSASETGAFSSCYSYAFSSVTCPSPLSLYLSTWDDSTSCASGMCARCAEEEEKAE